MVTLYRNFTISREFYILNTTPRHIRFCIAAHPPFTSKKKHIKSGTSSSYCSFLPSNQPGMISCTTLFQGMAQLFTITFFFPLEQTNTQGIARWKIKNPHNKLYQKEDKKENHISRNRGISSVPLRKKRQHWKSAYLLWFTSSLTVRWY